MRRKYTTARPPGNRTASVSQVLWFFCNTLPAGPFLCIRRTMRALMRRYFASMARRVGHRLRPTLRVVAGAGDRPRRSATSASAPTWPGTGARPRAREFLRQLWLAVTFEPAVLGVGRLTRCPATSGSRGTVRSLSQPTVGLSLDLPTAASPFRPPWPAAA